MPTFELTTNDGKRYQIDADTPELAQQAFDHAFGQSAPKAGGVVANIGAGANEMIAGAVGGPVDLMTGAINLVPRGVNAALGTNLPLIERPFGGSESIKSFMGLIGADPREVIAATPGENLARETGAAIPMMVAPYLAGRAAIERGVIDGIPGAAARLFGGPGGPGQGALSTTAGAAGNVAVGAGGVLGGHAAESILPEDSSFRPLANLAGNVIGGGLVAGGMGLGKGLVNLGAEKARELVGPLIPSMRDRLVGDTMRRNASDHSTLMGSLADDTPDLVPGSQPTTFQLSGDLGIGQLERAVRTRRPEPFAVRAGDQNKARLDQLGALAPEGSPAVVRDTLKQHLQRLDDDAQSLIGAAQKNAQQAFEMAGGQHSPGLYGALMREQLEAAKAAAKQNEGRLWQAIDPDGTLTINAAPVAGRAARILAAIPRTARMPDGEEAAVLGLAQTGGKAMPFSEFAALRGRLLQAIRDERINGQTPALRRMQQLRATMDDTISNAAENAAQADAGLLGRISLITDEIAGTATQARTAAGGYDSPGASTFPAGNALDAFGGAGTAGNPGFGSGNAAGRSSVSRPPQKPQDIVEFLIARGGVKDDGGELRAMDTNRVQGGYGTGGVGQGAFGVLSRKNGLSPDHAREVAEEAGYLKPGSTLSDLYDAIHDSTRGIPHYSDRDIDIVLNWEDFLKSGEMPPLPPLPTAPANFDAAATQRYRSAADATRDRAQTFNNQIVGPVLQERGAEYRMLESQVPERFMRNPESVQAFLSAGGKPETLQDALVADLRRTATDANGNLSPTRFQIWRTRRADALRAFPELDRRLNDAATAQQSVDMASATARQARVEFEKGAARHFLNADPEQAVRSVFSSKNPVSDMRELVRMTAGDPDAAAGLRRAVADHISRQYISATEVGTSGRPGISSNALQVFVRRNDRALRQIFPPEQMKSLQAIAADLHRSNRSIAGSKIPGQSNTAQDLAAQDRLGAVRTVGGELGAAGAGALGGWLLTGGAGGGAAGFVAGSALKNAAARLRIIGLESVEARLAEALLDPRLARTLLMKPTAANQKVIAQRLNQQLGTLLATAPARPNQEQRH